MGFAKRILYLGFGLADDLADDDERLSFDDLLGGARFLDEARRHRLLPAISVAMPTRRYNKRKVLMARRVCNHREPLLSFPTKLIVSVHLGLSKRHHHPP